MNKIITFATISLVALVLSGCSFAGTPKLSQDQISKLRKDISSYCTQGLEALNKNDIQTAKQKFLLASQQTGGDDLVETARALLGLAYTETCDKNYSQAEKDQRRAIEIYEKQLPNANTNVIMVRPISDLAKIYHHEGRHNEEKEALTRAVKCSVFGGPYLDQDAYVDDLMSLGIIYRDENNLLGAEALLRRALDLRKQTLCDSNYRIQQRKDIINDLFGILSIEGRRQDADALKINGYL